MKDLMKDFSEMQSEQGPSVALSGPVLKTVPKSILELQAGQNHSQLYQASTRGGAIQSRSSAETI
jgi:hypothetical protein